MQGRVDMTRRELLGTSMLGAMGFPLASLTTSSHTSAIVDKPLRKTFSMDKQVVRFYSSEIKKPLKIMVVGDTHLGLDDERGEPFRVYSKRMAEAYQRTRQAVTGAWTTPKDQFQESLYQAREAQVDLIALVGDIFSFPSEAAIAWVLDQLKASGLAWLYIAGNHDWHYEGLPGSSCALRAEWTRKQLMPLYQGAMPLMAMREIYGVRFVVIDNSTYEITPEQLDFFRLQVADKVPLVLMTHIPLYVPGRPIGFGCGHPQWGAVSDRNWQIERRPRWPEKGHTDVTQAFHREVFSTHQLLGLFAGHMHAQSIDVVNDIPQVVTAANATGGYVLAEFHNSGEDG